jgi:4-amino-4-deoxy-L-arabinose transferase-like glycosyltransferase
MKQFAVKVLLLISLSIVCASLGLGVAYTHYSSLLHRGELFRGIARDGWITDDASGGFSQLANIGNRLELEFNTWRPPVSPSHIEVFVCDQSAGDYLISAGTKLAISLAYDCPDKTLRFEVINPFQGSATDTRPLGAQLVNAKVTSDLGIALVDPFLVLRVGLMVALAAALLACVATGRFRAVVAIAVPILSALMLSESHKLDLTDLFWVWITSVAIGSGYLISSHIGNDSTSTASPNKSLRLFRALITALIFLGAAIRFYGINFGLPHNFHPDEVPKVNAIMQMIASDTLNPRYFLHPSLLLYCTYFMNSVLHWTIYDGDFRSTAFLAGRFVSAIAGTASIYLTYAIARRFIPQTYALLAAAMLAFSPLHITSSRYLKEDALLLFFILCCVAAVVRAAKEDDWRFLCLGAVCAGLAGSTKYSGILSIGILGCAPWLRSQRFIPDARFLKLTIAASPLVPIALLCASPYIIFDHPKFLSDFNYEREHMVRGHTEAIDAWSQFWMYHLRRSISVGIGEITTLVALMGVGLILWRRKIDDLFILGLLLAFYLPAELVRSKPAPQPERYIYPCLPFIAICAANFLASLRQKISTKLILCIACLALAGPLWRSIRLAEDVKNDTRVIAAKWIEENLPHGSKILLDWQPYGPHLPADKFDVSIITRKRLASDFSPRALKQSGADYLVLSTLFYQRYFTQPRSNTMFRDRFSAVFQQLPIIKEFTPHFDSYGFHTPTLTVFSLKPEAIASFESELAKKSAGQILLTSNEKLSYFFKAGE